MKITIKRILFTDQAWWRFFNKYSSSIRNDIVIGVTKLLSCKNTIRGYHQYHCSNPNCLHTKRVPHTCKSKACSSCGKKATEIWIKKQNDILPRTTWQHITFTMPSELWDFFWYNRQLLNQIAKMAAKAILSMAKKKNIISGIFIAIHTFGRDLKRNVHIHLSTTNGGISADGKQWKNLFFHQKTLMTIWRYNVIQLFRENASKLVIPPAIKNQLNHTFTFNQFLNKFYEKTWIVHCSKPSENHKYNVNYLANYTKRPAIAESKLKHYDGNSVKFRYLDHTSKSYRNFDLTVEEFIKRFIQHIPDVGFRMIRYYGFLANRVRGTLLPLVYKLLNQLPPKQNKNPTYAELFQQNFNINPLKCILCGNMLVLTNINFGNASIYELMKHHRELALLKKI